MKKICDDIRLCVQKCDFESLKTIYQLSQEINDICKIAAGNGNLECLKFAHEIGCHWDEETCTQAAINGQLECLRYAYENGCPSNKETCTRAAINGNLECLKYAHENGCPWDELTTASAAKFLFI